MTFSLFQILLAVALLAFVGLWRRSQSKRKQRSWDEIVAAFRADDCELNEVSERYLYRGGINATPAVYSEMLAHLTALFQESAGQLLPRYLEAM